MAELDSGLSCTSCTQGCWAGLWMGAGAAFEALFEVSVWILLYLVCGRAMARGRICCVSRSRGGCASVAGVGAAAGGGLKNFLARLLGPCEMARAVVQAGACLSLPGAEGWGVPTLPEQG